MENQATIFINYDSDTIRLLEGIKSDNVNKLIILSNGKCKQDKKIQKEMKKNSQNNIFLDIINISKDLSPNSKIAHIRTLFISEWITGNDLIVNLTSKKSDFSQLISCAVSWEHGFINKLGIYTKNERFEKHQYEKWDLLPRTIERNYVEDNRMARLMLACFPLGYNELAIIRKEIRGLFRGQWEINGRKFYSIAKKLVNNQYLENEDKKYIITNLGKEVRLDKKVEFAKILHEKTKEVINRRKIVPYHQNINS